MGYKPHRAHEIQLKLSADTIDGLVSGLEEIARKAQFEQLSRTSISGGYSSGWVLEYRHDPEMTHERWAAENKAYVDALHRDTTHGD